MNTLAMNVRYSADSGFLEEPLVQLLSNNPLINCTKKKPSFPAGVFTKSLFCQQGILEASTRERKLLKSETLLTARHGYLSGFKVGHKTSQANKWLTEENRRFLT